MTLIYKTEIITPYKKNLNMWTISDFPAYAMLSGWSTKRKFACPC